MNTATTITSPVSNIPEGYRLDTSSRDNYRSDTPPPPQQPNYKTRRRIAKALGLFRGRCHGCLRDLDLFRKVSQ